VHVESPLAAGDDEVGELARRVVATKRSVNYLVPLPSRRHDRCPKERVNLSDDTAVDEHEAAHSRKLSGVNPMDAILRSSDGKQVELLDHKVLSGGARKSA
jgi:hypothetical protein